MLPMMPHSLLGLGLGLTRTTGNSGLGFCPKGVPKLCEDNKPFKRKEAFFPYRYSPSHSASPDKTLILGTHSSRGAAKTSRGCRPPRTVGGGSRFLPDC